MDCEARSEDTDPRCLMLHMWWFEDDCFCVWTGWLCGEAHFLLHPVNPQIHWTLPTGKETLVSSHTHEHEGYCPLGSCPVWCPYLGERQPHGGKAGGEKRTRFLSDGQGGAEERKKKSEITTPHRWFKQNSFWGRAAQTQGCFTVSKGTEAFQWESLEPFRQQNYIKLKGTAALSVWLWWWRWLPQTK